MDYDLVLRDGTLITASDTYAADLAINRGRIAAIGHHLRGTREIDASGLQVLPGGIDVHTHLDLRLGNATSVDDFEAGTAAAACGGITSICDYAWQERGQTLEDTVATWKAKARGKAHIDYGFHIIIADASPDRLDEIPNMVSAGYPSFKVFLMNEFGIGDAAFVRVLGAARAVGAIVNVHAENGEMLDFAARAVRESGRRDPRYYAESRPSLAEAEATRRAIDYAELLDAEIYVVHLSCRDALEAVRAGRARGVRVSAETRTIYLALNEERYEPGGIEAAKFVGAPPLRTADDQTALWDGLRNGDIQTIASDNCSWTIEQKAAGKDDFTQVPYGVPGLETEMQVIYSEGVGKGRISANAFVAVFSTNPARLFGLYPRKGTIAVGTDADLVLFDPSRSVVLDEKRLHSKAGYDPFHGFTITGLPVLTLSRGEIIARDGELLSTAGRGQHILRSRARLVVPRSPATKGGRSVRLA
jgi:dihydropyrimidinase